MTLMFDDPHRVRGLFAALASSGEDLRSLPRSALAALEEKAAAAATFTECVTEAPAGGAPVCVVLVGKPHVKPARLVEVLQPLVRGIMLPLLKQEDVRLPAGNVSIVARVRSEALREVWETRTVEQMLVAEFMRLLREQPLPYRMCPQCGAVFVRYRQQKFCGPACTYAATQAHRGDAKREAMRIYMRDKRAREKAVPQMRIPVADPDPTREISFDEDGGNPVVDHHPTREMSLEEDE